MAFLLRWIAAFALLAGIHNPTGWAYLRWSRAAWDSHPLAVALAGAALGGALLLALRATLRAIGLFGVMLTAAVVATAAWVLHDMRLLALGGEEARVWTGLVALATAIAIGLWWRDLRRRLEPAVGAEAAEAAAGSPAPQDDPQPQDEDAPDRPEGPDGPDGPGRDPERAAPRGWWR